MKKQYQNIGAQLVNLEKNKNVDKTTINLKCFYEKTYLDLVTPYSDLIALGRDEKGKHIYPEKVDFNEYLEYNKIDSAICNHLHVLIGCFEKLMKNFLMHKYCQKMKECGDRQVKDFSWVSDYCKGVHAFDLVPIDKVFSEESLIPATQDMINRRKEVLKVIAGMKSASSRNNMVQHYQEKHKYVPMFVAIHSLSLGQLLTLFSILPQDNKNELVCMFNGVEGKRYPDSAIEKFEKDAIRIQVIRNIVNHYEPIFPFIQNTEFRTFSSLTTIFEKLANYYKRTFSFSNNSLNIKKNHESRNAYSLEFHLKIERVIESLS